MYNAYFNFKAAPFSIAPDPRYLYMTGQHREALAHLVYGLNSEGGCILLTGEVGTGKTTVCRCLLEQIPEHTNIALVVNPKVTAIELLETLCDELKIAYPDENNTIKTYLDRINAFLIEANARNEKTVLIIDEAQNLDDTVLEQLRLLTNLETNQRKLLQIIILGQPELLEILSRQEMRQLAQRITARFHLNALSRHEVKAYINHRLAVAGQNAQLFPDHTIAQLYRLSQGVPRLLNVICDRALLGTYVQNRPVVDSKTLTTAAKEVFGELKHTQYRTRRSYFLPISILAVIAVGTALALFSYRPELFSGSTAAVFKTLTPATRLIAKQDPAAAVATAPASSTSADDATFETMDEAVSVAIPPADDPINDFINAAGDENEAIAFDTLLRQWRPDYMNENGTPVCDNPAHSLSCLHERGNLNSLRKLNRPAVLKLYGNNGRIAHVVLSRLDKNRATLVAADDSFYIDVSLLENYWYGEFSLLWQPPPFYQQAVSPGSNGPVVQWLGQQLTRLYGHQQTPTIYDVYRDELVTRVETFQQSKGLVADGIAGPLTLIHLNTDIGAPSPLLYAAPEGQK
ncbi:MAG: AAA family ATPase [Gammaproteobacteria bacterium]|nr:AAA family ATPase [Gammaproteobacteria bacterium]